MPISESLKRAQDKYYKKNKEYYADLRRKWNAENPDKNKEYTRKFQARKKELNQVFKELAAIDCY